VTDQPTDLPLAARALLVGAGIDLDRYDTEIEFARIEATYEEERAA
jgi:hypothetical protein